MTIHTTLRAFFLLCWIGLCVEALVWQTRLLAGLPLQPGWLDGFVFGSTVFGYYYTHPVQLLRWTAWLAGGLGAVCFCGLDRTVQGLAVGPAVLWSAYYGLERSGQRGLRSSPFFKPVIIALVWAWVTVWLPSQQLLAWQFAARTFFIFTLALAYDLADMQYDAQRRFITLAGRLGERYTYYLIYVLFGLAALCTGINFLEKNIALTMALALWSSYWWSAILLRFILQHNMAVIWKKVLIDGLMVMEAGLVLISTN